MVGANRPSCVQLFIADLAALGPGRTLTVNLARCGESSNLCAASISRLATHRGAALPATWCNGSALPQNIPLGQLLKHAQHTALSGDTQQHAEHPMARRPPQACTTVARSVTGWVVFTEKIVIAKSTRLIVIVNQEFWFHATASL
jgi:hypothetical protein